MKTLEKKSSKGTATSKAANQTVINQETLSLPTNPAKVEKSKKPTKETKPTKPANKPEIKETKPAKTEQKPAMTRITAMTIILKDNPLMERDEACKLADSLYMEQTGKQSNNPQEQLFCYRYAIQVFAALGLTNKKN